MFFYAVIFFLVKEMIIFCFWITQYQKETLKNLKIFNLLSGHKLRKQNFKKRFTVVFVIDI